MTEIYSGQEYSEEYKVKKRMLRIWFALLAVYIIISVIIIVSFAILPYGTKKTVFITSDIMLSMLFWGFTFFYFNLKYNRIRKYVKILKHIMTGLKEQNSGEYLRIEDTIEVKEGVDFYKMVIKEWNEKKQEYFERKVLIDSQKPKPNIPDGKRVRYITQGNILIKYKVL